MPTRPTLRTRPKKRKPHRVERRTSLPGLSIVTEKTGRQFFRFRFFDQQRVRRSVHVGWKTPEYSTRQAIRDALLLKESGASNDCALQVAELVGRFGLATVQAAVLAYRAPLVHPHAIQANGVAAPAPNLHT